MENFHCILKKNEHNIIIIIIIIGIIIIIILKVLRLRNDNWWHYNNDIRYRLHIKGANVPRSRTPDTFPNNNKLSRP